MAQKTRPASAGRVALGKQRQSGRLQALDQRLRGAEKLHCLLRQGLGRLVDAAHDFADHRNHIRNEGLPNRLFQIMADNPKWPHGEQLPVQYHAWLLPDAASSVPPGQGS